MYILNKIVGAILSPVAVGMLLAAAALVILLWRGCAKGTRARRWAAGLLIASLAWFWAMSAGVTERVAGLYLERCWAEPGAARVKLAEEYPVCDAIVVLGGGMGANTNAYPYAEMFASADRIWHAARLYRAGRAPLVVPTGTGDREAALPLLRDLGVPDDAIAGEFEARNTEENAKFVERLLGPGKRVLLVTSAWHMRRALLMYRRYAPGLEIVPAAADYEATVTQDRPLEFKDFLPGAEALAGNAYFMKEIVGYWGYRLFRPGGGSGAGPGGARSGGDDVDNGEGTMHKETR